MKITRCIVGYKSDDIHQDELRVTKPEFQPFYENGFSINEMTMNLYHIGNMIKNMPNPEIEYIILDIEDSRLPKNTVMVIYLNIDESWIGVGLWEYDDDPNVQLPIREISIGNIYGDPLVDDGKLFFFSDLQEIVDDHVEEARKIYEEKQKGATK